MIKYSDKAKRAYAYFYRPYNDIDIYVEDMTTRALHEILYKRLLKGKAKVTRIIQLGGRKNVIEEACSNDNTKDSRPRIYIIDADLDHFTGEKPPELNNLYRLNSYCVENLLICEKGLTTIAYEASCNEYEDTISDKFNFTARAEEIRSSFRSLFIIFGVVSKLRLPIDTVSMRGFRFYTQCTPIRIDLNKIEDKIKDLRKEIMKYVSLEKYREMEKRITENVTEMPTDLMNMISGKDFVLPFFYKVLKNEFSYQGDIYQLKPRLAGCCRTDVDPNLGPALESCIKKFKHAQELERPTS